jgi:hypothetical protein
MTTMRPRTAASIRAEREFRERVAQLGGVVLEPTWLGAVKPHRVRCSAGHDCTPRPNSVQQGQGICRACIGVDPATAERVFRERLAKLGAVLLEPTWLGGHHPHRVRCSAGHDCAPRPSDVKRGVGVCRECAGKDPAAAERAFRARVEELGGVVLEPIWLGRGRPHRVRCAAGHECSPRPSGVQQGQGICRVCAGLDPATAERAFRERLAKLGAVLLEPTWLGVNRPHRVRCAAGHECSPRPASVQQGQGICLVCAGMDSATAERVFRERLAKLGAVLLEPTWLGVNRPHRVRCSAGHDCAPRPSGLKRNRGICLVCAGMDSATAERAFRKLLEELGAVLLEPTWLGVGRPHRARCAAGHECFPRPADARRRGSLCLVCVGKDSATAERAFRVRVEKLGGVVLEPVWLGNRRPHRVRCAAGHDCAPRPSSVQRGGGICRFCAGHTWDVFYVVVDDDRGWVKFGITSGDPRPRLATHALDGFGRVVRVLEKLPGTTAPDLERDVLAALRLAGERPVQRREYFDAAVTALVLDIVDNYPMPPQER